MYKPKFNHVLVEIDDNAAKWGKSDDGNLGGEVYREGRVLEVPDRGNLFAFGDTKEMPFESQEFLIATLASYVGKQIMWNEGHEAGTVFEHGGKKYALIYWFDIIGVKE